MAQIVPKLNLNKTPALVESHSLIFSKNIRLDVDGTIHRDYGVFPLSITKGNDNDKLINYNNILNRILSDIKYQINNSTVEDYYTTIYNRLTYMSGGDHIYGNGKYTDGQYKIVGIIASSNEFFLFINGTYTYIEGDIERKYDNSIIIRYDEKDKTFYPCNCNWSWSGGTIYGCVINNLIGEKVLNIAESGTFNLVPLKSINLNTSTLNDDETIYTQVPNVPLTNLSYAKTLSCVIPNGVYQFYVRYKIRKDFYTDWFPASNEIFVGNRNTISTSFGTLQYVNIHRDSDNSFVLSVKHLVDKYKDNYTSFQVGFILSHDDSHYARAWKHFDFGVTNINFDYKAEDAIELDVTDFTKSTYGLYNVGNLTTFKNRLYISNYTETNFNDKTLQSVADAIEVDIKTSSAGNTYAGYTPSTTPIGSKNVISGLIIDNEDKSFIGENGIFDTIITTKSFSNTPSIKEAITNAINNEDGISKTDGLSPDLYGVSIISRITTLKNAKDSIKQEYKDVTTAYMERTYSFDYESLDIIGVTINGRTKNKTDIIPYIYNTPRYLDENANWINGAGSIDDKIIIKLARKVKIICTTKYYNNGSLIPGGGDKIENDELSVGTNNNIDRPSSGTEIGGTTSSTDVDTFYDTYYQDIEIQFVAFENKYNSSDGGTLTNNTTLIPYQKYKFYIHFVKSNGETTNGYYCTKVGEVEAPYMPQCNSIIYPKFKNINIPIGYVACFFSISHTNINTATLFNIKDDVTEGYKEGSCIDINMMLIPGYKNIHIKQEIKHTTEGPTIVPGTPDTPTPASLDLDVETDTIETYTGQYYYSSDSSLPRYFGADGVVVFDKKTFDNNRLAYVVNDYSIPETENIELIKCTPYINESNISSEGSIKVFDNYKVMNLLGYICSISPLIRDVCIKYYSDGSSVYFKDNNTDNITEYNPTGTLHLTELSKYIDAPDDKKLSNFALKTSKNVNIYSNYNLNYVALSEEPKMSIKTFYNRTASSSTVTESDANNSNTILLRLIPSQLMSDIYTLPSMYKAYIRKLYSPYVENETIRFENTVRSSILYGDESNINVLTFAPNDYYNVPTNRGIIVNMVSVGDAIIVHTQDSMFKFSGSNSLQSTEGEILTTESRPFDTGVSEVFGSDFGFAGLQNKTDHIITEHGYIFFDRDSRIVYVYSGQGQIVKISDSIEKLFRHRDISRINFANDYYNNRFFMSIMFVEKTNVIENEETVEKEVYYPITLSFNLSEQIKSFVSLHDFYYHYSFNTKTKCYFLTADNKDICDINKEYKGCYTKLELYSDKTYPQRKEITNISAINFANNELTTYNINSYDSIIDVIVNDNYETIKTLDAVNWCGTKIIKEFADIDNDNLTSLMIAEDINYDIPCKYIRVYTDTCMTPLNDCSSRSNDSAITSLNSYRYPRFNQGYWTFNYFRNILNSKNHLTMTDYSGDNNSLIEGKYFVTRFLFDTDFKFESLQLNYKIKY